VLIIGVFLIASAIADQIIMPNLISSVNDLTDSLPGKVLSALPEDVQTSQSNTAARSDMNSGIDQIQSQLTTTERYMQIASITTGAIGIGLVTYGGLAKNNKKNLTTQDTALEILKKRLAKGEITKTEFDNLKRHIK
jgi:hypothetical protein